MILELHHNAGFSVKKQTTNEYCSPCPGCGGNDRFIIFTDKGTYWCRQCHKKGDAIQYLRDFQGMSFPDAAREIGKDISLDRGKPRTQPTVIPITAKKEQPELWRDKVSRFIVQTTKALNNSADVLAWLRLERGITKETAEKFSLGWFDHDIWQLETSWGIKTDGKKIFIPSGLVIPWQGKRIRIRRNNPVKYPKYHIVKGSRMDSFKIGTLYENAAIIVESELDAILLAQEIKREVFIVALGSCAIKPDESLLNALMSCPVVLVILDTDEAGAKASRWWLENVPSTYRTLTPKQYGKDITEAFLNGLDLNEWISLSLELYAEEIGGNVEAPF